jgi:hypothetical protein
MDRWKSHNLRHQGIAIWRKSEIQVSGVSSKIRSVSLMDIN